MKTLNYLKIMLLCVLAVGFTSCGSDDDEGADLDVRLCRTWVEEYAEDSQVYTHQLKFVRSGNSGQEQKKQYDPETGTTHTETRDFTWAWQDNAKECLVLKYGAGETKYLENVWVREHYLSGRLGGEIIMMVDADYKK